MANQNSGSVPPAPSPESLTPDPGAPETVDLYNGCPVALLTRWLAEAEGNTQGDANAMMLATSTPDGHPSARIVLCKQIESDPPAAVFYTNYTSRKGRELESNPRAAGVFYWPALKRQARIEGAVIQTTPEESDAYFQSRPMLARAGAIASRQSQPMPSRTIFAARVLATAARPRAALQRPPHWGGFRILLDRIELWAAGNGRLHDRVTWVRASAGQPVVWKPTRLYP